MFVILLLLPTLALAWQRHVVVLPCGNIASKRPNGLFSTHHHVGSNSRLWLNRLRLSSLDCWNGELDRHIRTGFFRSVALGLSSNNNSNNNNSNKKNIKTDWEDRSARDSNLWQSSQDDTTNNNNNTNKQGADWKQILEQKEDGSFWASFEQPPPPPPPPPTMDEQDVSTITTAKRAITEHDDDDGDDVVVASSEADADSWLDAIAALSAEEVQFNMKEADRADQVRQMQEWGFTQTAIANTLGVATDTSLEIIQEPMGMQPYREQMYMDTVDLEKVESHTTVEIDEETGEPFRSRMVYVDEHTCIGCTHCAMTARSTFFMHSEHGRARVFQQWGDDEETIQVAIETCPVDCIHYIPYEELVQLEQDRRHQNINFKGRLVSQAEFGISLSHLSGGGNNRFTAPQQISGNMKARCSNCPTRGCFNCPMYGVGRNPEYERKEQQRKERLAKRRMKEQREREQKSANL